MSTFPGDIERPLLAESRPSNQAKLTNPNDRFREKRTFSWEPPEFGHLMTALPPIPDIRLVLGLTSANDPMVLPRFSGQFHLVLMSAFRTRLD